MEPKKMRYEYHHDLKSAVRMGTLSEEGANFLARRYNPHTPAGHATITHIRSACPPDRLRSLIRDAIQTSMPPKTFLQHATGQKFGTPNIRKEATTMALTTPELQYLNTAFKGRTRALDYLLSTRTPNEIKQLITDLQTGRKSLSSLKRNLARKNPDTGKKRNNRRRGK